MKKTIFIILMMSVFNCNGENYSRLTGMAERYEKEDGSTAEKNTAFNSLIPVIKVENEEIKFEKNTLVQLASKLGGKIKDSRVTQWLCYTFPQKNESIWFLSNNEMQHGYLSGVALSRSDIKNDCIITDKLIHIRFGNIHLGTAWENFKIASGAVQLPQSGSVSLYSELPLKNDFTQINMADFTFLNGKLTAMLFTQVSSD